MSSENFVDKFTEILIQKKAITKETAAALKKDFHNRTSVPLEEFLIEEGLVEESDVLEALSVYYQVPPIDVTGVFFEHHLVTMFPQSLMKRKRFIPFKHDGDILIVVASNPRDPELPDIIGDYVSYDVAFMVGIKRDITNAIEEFYQLAPTEVDLDYHRNDRNKSDFEKDSVINVNLEKDPND